MDVSTKNDPHGADIVKVVEIKPNKNVAGYAILNPFITSLVLKPVEYLSPSKSSVFMTL